MSVDKQHECSSEATRARIWPNLGIDGVQGPHTPFSYEISPLMASGTHSKRQPPSKNLGVVVDMHEFMLIGKFIGCFRQAGHALCLPFQ